MCVYTYIYIYIYIYIIGVVTSLSSGMSSSRQMLQLRESEPGCASAMVFT